MKDFDQKKENVLSRPSHSCEFAEEADRLVDGRVHLVGFSFDGTACFRKGARNGPDEIRKISYGVESYSPYLNLDLEDFPPVLDLGNLIIGKGENQHKVWKEGSDSFFSLVSEKNLIDNKIKIITLGGEHSISYAPIRTYLNQCDDLVLIHLDAHADLRDGYEGYHYSHASIIRRALDHFSEGHQLIQYGIRSGTKEEYKWMDENKTSCRSQNEFIQRVAEISNERPIYLTLDLDYFDPCFLPGTGTPEAGGEDFHSFIRLIKVLKEKNLVGADIVELAPDLDSSGNSSVFAAKVLREVLLAVSELRAL